jgi:hypothetical protein
MRPEMLHSMSTDRGRDLIALQSTPEGIRLDAWIVERFFP